jgi:tetratricopeptide (TPR) repeat protein
MNLVSRLALVAALGLAAPLGSVALAQALSPNVGKPLQAASNAARSGNTAAATAAINQARAAADTPAERRKVAEMAAFVYTRAGQFGRAAQELESIGASPRQLAPLYYRAGQFNKAIAAAQKAGGADMQVIIGQSYLRTGKFDEAAKVYERLARSNPKYLENLAAAQYKSGDKKAYLATTEKLIKFDPSPARWKTLLVDLKGAQMPREAKLALFHLMDQTNNLSRPEDYQEYAKLAIISNQPGVAKAALDKAKAANALGADAMTTTLVGEAEKRAAQARASIAKLPKDGAGQFQAGNILLGASNYPAAVAAYDRAIAANAPQADAARLFKGIAQIRAGQTGAARQTLAAIPATSGVKDVASLWSLYASTRG